MNEIIKKSLDNSFEIFLGWSVIAWAYWFSNSLAKHRSEKIDYAALRENVIGFSLCLVVPAAISTAIFFLRIRKSPATDADYIYCLTAFILLSFSGIAGVFWGFHKDKFKE